jgi:hypothetical protein
MRARNSDIVRRALAGELYRSIAADVGLHPTTVGEIARAGGVPAKRGGASHPMWRGGRWVRRDGYVMVKAPDHPRADRVGYVLEHIPVAERALGRHLPERHPVHHVNEDPADNQPENLVICEDSAYHALLHQRARALRACGNPAWRICSLCKKYDAPENLYIHPTQNSARHRECYRAYRRQWVPPAKRVLDRTDGGRS